MIAAGKPREVLFGTGVMPRAIPERNIRAFMDAALK